ncbi:MAG: hypothetical protein U0521_25385 [Anaerolineae bacterium]
MANRDETDRYHSSLQDEVDSAWIYRALADKEAQSALAEVYRRLADTEEKHAGFWEEKLRAAGQPIPPAPPGVAGANARVAGAALRRNVRPADAGRSGSERQRQLLPLSRRRAARRWRRRNARTSACSRRSPARRG